MNYLVEEFNVNNKKLVESTKGHHLEGAVHIIVAVLWRQLVYLIDNSLGCEHAIRKFLFDDDAPEKRRTFALWRAGSHTVLSHNVFFFEIGRDFLRC